MGHRRERMRLGAWCAGAGVALCVATGWAPSGAERGGVAGPIDVDTFTARNLARIALMDLRSVRDATEADHRVAKLLLDWAQEYEPENEQIVRYRLEAAWASGDERAAEELTRRIVQLNPGDTVALLRMIAANIGRLDTVEARVQAYDRLLSRGGAALPASVRSRLALDAALLLRERGDEAGFADRLKQAVALDSTHKEAAALAAAYFSSRVDDPVGRFDLLTNLLMADPLDPNIHATIARELASAGALDQAARFHGLATGLMQAAGAPIPAKVAEEAMVLDWRRRGTEGLIAALNDRLAALRRTAVDQATRAQRTIDPASVTLPAAHERARALAAHVAGDAVTLESALFDLEMIQRLNEAAAKASGAEETEDQRRSRLVFDLYLVITRIWLGVDVEASVGRGEELQQQIPEGRGAVDVVELLPVFLELGRGHAAEALEMLEAIDQPYVLADAAAVLALDMLGREQESAARLRALAARDALTIPSAWAAETLKRRGLEPPKRPFASALISRASSIPGWIDRMTRDPTAFEAIEIEAARSDLDALEPAELVLRIRNTSPIPLSVGPDRVINTTFLLGPRILAGPLTLHEFAGPEILDATRRLRLEPHETLEVRFDPGLSATGLVLDAAVTRATRVRWRVTQGPLITTSSNPPSFAPGPLCMSAATGFINRPILPEAQITVADVIRRVKEGSEETLPVVLGAARAILPSQLTDIRLDAASVEAIAQACAERYQTLSVRGRALMLAVMPNAWQVPAMAVLDRAAAADTDPRLMMLYLVTRVRVPTDPALERAEASEDERVRAVAQTVRARVETNRGGYGTRRLYFTPASSR